MINIQPIEKPDRANSGLSLDVHSIFYTIQGEGPYCGQPAVFVRLAGCNLQCPLCDTEYTSGRKRLSIHEIAYHIADSYAGERTDKRAPIVVITGGEPFRQNLYPLCSLLAHGYGYTVQIETNGTLGFPEERFGDLVADLGSTLHLNAVYIVCSPKTGKVHPDIQRTAMAFKYVLKAGDQHEDGLPNTALDHTAHPRVARPERNIPIYLQPVDEKDDELNRVNLQAVVASCLAHGHNLQLQIHKLINVE